MEAGQGGKTPSKERHRRPRKRGSAGHSDPEMEASLNLGESESKSEVWELGGMFEEGIDQQGKLSICIVMKIWDQHRQMRTSMQKKKLGILNECVCAFHVCHWLLNLPRCTHAHSCTGNHASFLLILSSDML